MPGKPSRLKTRLIVDFVLAATVPILIMGLFTAKLMRDSLLREVTLNNENFVRSLASHASLDMTFALQSLRGLKRFLETASPTRAEETALIAALVREQPNIKEIRVLDREGRTRIVAPPGEEPPGLDMSGQPYFQQAQMTDQPVWSYAAISPGTGLPTAALALGYSNGLLTAVIDFPSISQAMASFVPHADSAIAVTDQTGVYIAHTHASLVLERDRAPEFNAILASGKNDVSTRLLTIGGASILATACRIKDSGWTAFIFQPEEAVVAPARHFLAMLAAMALLFLALGTAASLARLKGLFIHLGNVAKGAEAVAQGEYSVSVSGQGYLELAALADRFNAMANTVKTREDRILELNRQLEERLEEVRGGRRRLQNVVDFMPSVLIGMDAAMRVTLWNRRAATATGLEFEAVQGKPARQAYPLPQEVEAAIKAAMATGLPQPPLRQSRLEGDRRIQEEIAVFPLADHQDSAAVARIDDVTEKNRLDEIMVQTEKMLSVGGLAAGMAHEINNPLGIILASSQNIARRLSPDFEKNVAEARAVGADMESMQRYLERREIFSFLARAEEAAKRAAAIIKNMLDFSRRSESRMASCSVNAMLDKVVELASNDYDLKKRYDVKRVEIVRDYAGDLPLVTVMETEIEQVFLNVFRNAAQSMSEKTSFEGGPRIVLRTAADGDCLRVEIGDNGPGMPEEVRKRVFEPFFTTKEVGVGTGLGLSVSYFIISHKHGGEISVTSEPGHGATFVIRLPLAPRGAAQTAPA